MKETHDILSAKGSDLAALTVPREKAQWLPPSAKNVVFIPVGANLPSPETAWMKESGQERPPTVAVFSLSPGRVGAEEVKTIVEAARYVTKRMGRVRLAVFGRNSESAEKLLREGLERTDLELSVTGILAAEEVVRVLGKSDVLLFTRGPISTRRGSAIAGIACGLPVVATRGRETAAPVTEAGVVLTEPGEQFGPALARVLGDPVYRASLEERSRKAQQRYFSWQAIAQQYVSALSGARGHDVKAESQFCLNKMLPHRRITRFPILAAVLNYRGSAGVCGSP